MNTPTKELIVALLGAWIRQRPGLEFCNYGDITAYRSELRSITRDLAHARALLAYASGHSGITAERLMEAFPRAYSGRLKLAERADGKWALEYCTGQYWPTEYRKAAAAVLASAIWDYQRESMPAPVAHVVESWGKWNGNSFDKEKTAPLGIHEAARVLVEKGGQAYGHIADLYRDGEGRARLSAGDWMRRKLQGEFGRTIAKSYFN